MAKSKTTTDAQPETKLTVKKTAKSITNMETNAEAHTETNQDSRAPLVIEIPADFAEFRLDKALAELLPAHSRSTLQTWLKAGLVYVDRQPAKQRLRLIGGERVTISPPPTSTSTSTSTTTAVPAQPFPLDIIAQDEDLLVLNKPAGLVVHPGAGNPDHTLLNGLLHFDPALRALPRAGIIHRLDKDTSGLLVIARTETARLHLTAQLTTRTMKRHYAAIAHGVMIAGERIAAPIARHRHDRVKMAVSNTGKPAVTHIRVTRKFRAHCLLHAELESGRTHQIRVHLSWRGFPLVGDKLYGRRANIPAQCSPELQTALQNFPRQALHATRLSLTHPKDGKPREWQQPPPQDFADLLAALETDKAQNT